MTTCIGRCMDSLCNCAQFLLVSMSYLAKVRMQALHLHRGFREDNNNLWYFYACSHQSRMLRLSSQDVCKCACASCSTMDNYFLLFLCKGHIITCPLVATTEGDCVCMSTCTCSRLKSHGLNLWLASSCRCVMESREFRSTARNAH